MTARIPGFFIVGAPKCGTTSLAAWLAEHRQVFMAHPKEPSFFDSDSPRVGVRRLEHYLRCFSQAGDQHLAIGEASPNYLHSGVAIANIRAFNPEARFVVALRDPVRMAPSLHSQLYYNHHEDIADFAEAWGAQARRREGRDLPPHGRLPQFLQYRSACALGSQLARLIELAGRERVCAVLLEDIEQDPRREYLRVLEFLGVPDDGRSEFGVLNSSAARGSSRSWLPARDFGYLKQRLGLAHVSLRDWSKGAPIPADRGSKKAGMPPALHAELVAAFESEVRLLESLLGRDLHAAWHRGRSGNEEQNAR